MFYKKYNIVLLCYKHYFSVFPHSLFEYGLLTDNNENIIVETEKKTENDDCMIVLFYGLNVKKMFDPLNQTSFLR